MQKVQGFAQQGGLNAITSGVSSTSEVEASYPGCTVTVYVAGTLTLASIYSDAAGTPEANPFTSSVTDASYAFYVAPGDYDLRFSGTGITTPFTIGGITVLEQPFNAGIFDANDPPYSLVANSSGASATNTTGLQAAIDAAVAYAIANNGVAVIELDPGEYYLSGALQHSNAVSGTNLYNAQITIPKVLSSSQRVSLTIRSKQQDFSPASVFAATTGNVTFRSTLTGGAYDATWGWPSIIGGPEPKHGTSFTDGSLMKLELVGVGIRQATNPSYANFDFRCINSVVVRNYKADTTEIVAPFALPTQPTHPTGVAGLMPISPIIDTARYEGFNSAIGYYGGFGICELTYAEELHAYKCHVAFNIQAPYYHSPIIQTAFSGDCPYALGYIDPSLGITTVPVDTTTKATYNPIIINNFDIEEAISTGGWNDQIAEINDPSSTIHGLVNYTRVIGNVGNAPGLFNMVGGRNLKLVDNLLPHNSFDIITDSFNGGPAGTLITTRYPRINQGGKWLAVAGLNDFEYTAGGGIRGSTAGDNQNITETNTSDGYISVNGRMNAGNADVAIIFRYTDANNYWGLEWPANTGTARVFKKVAGVGSTVGSTTTMAPVLNLYYSLEVILSGSTITAKINGVIVTGSALTGQTFNQTATKHGIYAFTQNVNFTNFRVSSYNN